MSSNLPPGVSPADIPGDRPEDVALDEMLDGPVGEVLMKRVFEINQAGEEVAQVITDALDAIRWCEFCGQRIDPQSEEPQPHSSYCSDTCAQAYSC